MRALWVALLVASVSLAGCADDDAATVEETEVVDKESFQLAAGKGAIAGLLVDDRFRPIDLEDTPETEIQFTGFVLLQETGEETKTNANGEFTFVDLEPGTYTLRVSVDAHEAVPQKVRVEEGVFNEASIVARRVLSEGGSILTQEYSVFIPCQVSRPDSTTSAGQYCATDLSGDSERIGFRTNYTGLNATFVITEMKSNKEASRDGALKIVIRDVDEGEGSSGDYFANDAITEGNYLRIWMRLGEPSPFDIESRNLNWTNERPFDTQLWAQGLYKDETNDAWQTACNSPLPLNCGLDSRGVGAQIGVRGQFIQTVFIGAPEVDVETYCVLC